MLGPFGYTFLANVFAAAYLVAKSRARSIGDLRRALLFYAFEQQEHLSLLAGADAATAARLRSSDPGSFFRRQTLAPRAREPAEAPWWNTPSDNERDSSTFL